jgi:hypothetical protein
MSDEEIGKLGDLTNYSFPQLTEIVEKRRPSTPREQARSPQQQIMFPIRKVDQINKYLKKGYRIRRELTNKQVVLELPMAHST